MILTPEILSKLSKDPECKRLIERLQSTSDQIEKLEDEYDMKAAEDYMRKRDSGALKTCPISEVCKKVGIDWDFL